MNLTISPQLRLVAVLGLAATAVLMAGLYFMTRAQLAAEEEATPAPVVHRPAPTASRPEATTKPKATAADTTKAKTAKPSTTPTAKKPAVQPTLAMRLAVQHRLPFSIARALTEHRVVVAALVIPDASLDTTVIAEAQSAAKEAGVGFVTVNVLRERAGRALAERLGVIETPAVIVYRRPAKAFIKLEGFTDRDTVAQAVANAFGR